MSVETKYGEAIMKQTQEMAEMFNEEMFRDVTAYISQIDQAPSEDR